MEIENSSQNNTNEPVQDVSIVDNENIDNNTQSSSEAETKVESTSKAGDSGKPSDTGNDTKNEDTLLGSKDEAKTVEPVQYTDFTISEDSQINEEVLQEFKNIAAESGVPQEKAQALLDLAAKNSQKAIENQQNEYAKVREGWVKEIKEDSEFGGINFKETLIRAQRTLNNFGGEELTDLLNSSGLGDNPHVIKMLAKIDNKLGEDVTEIGEASKTKLDAADVLFPKSGK